MDVYWVPRTFFHFFVLFRTDQPGEGTHSLTHSHTHTEKINLEGREEDERERERERGREKQLLVTMVALEAPLL